MTKSVERLTESLADLKLKFDPVVYRRTKVLAAVHMPIWPGVGLPGLRSDPAAARQQLAPS